MIKKLYRNVCYDLFGNCGELVWVNCELALDCIISKKLLYWFKYLVISAKRLHIIFLQKGQIFYVGLR